MHQYGRQRELEGLQIYSDRKGQKVYLDPFSRNGYIITPEKKDRFLALNNVALYGALTFVFAYVMFELDLRLALALSLAVTLLLEWRFRRFMNSCAFYKNFKPVRKNGDASSSASKGLIIFKAVLYLALSTALILSAVFIKTDDSMVYGGTIALSIACLFAFFRNLSICFSNKRKTD